MKLIVYMILIVNFLNALNITKRTSKLMIRIGHIGAVNVMPKAEEILKMCQNELRKEGILNDDFDLE